MAPKNLVAPFGRSGDSGRGRLAARPSPTPEPTQPLASDRGVWSRVWARLPRPSRWLGGGRRLSRGFRQELGQGLERLRRLTGETEGDFLRLGEQVQAFFLAAQSMTEQGSRVVDLVSGQTVSEAAQRLESLVEETRARFRRSQTVFAENLEILASVRQEVAVASRPLAGFQQMVMGLRVLGISTRIESARMQGADEGFQFLADEVTRLSDTIKEQTEGMAAQLTGLRTRLDETLGSLDGLGAGLSGEADSLATVIDQSLGELRQWRGQSELAAARMADSTRQVHANVAEVVSSMQFHDITRQRLEHVHEALSGLATGQVEAATDEVCQLQTALLGHAVAELDQAAGTIQASLRGIAGSVRQVAQDAHHLARGADGQEASFLERLEVDLSGIMAAAGQTAGALARLRDLVEAVVGTLERVSGSLRSIDTISYAIKFVALNAAIKSARLGGEGAALESLAQAIQNLSAEAHTATQELSGVLGHLGQSADSLRRAMAADSGNGEQTVPELEAVLEAIRANNQTCDDLLRQMEDEGHDLAERLEQGAEGIRFHLGIKQCASLVLTCLGRFQDQREPNPGAKRAGAGGDLENLAQRYTMASERQIHQAWTQGGTTALAARPGVDPEPGPTAAPPSALGSSAEETELGDNVELF